MPDVPAHPLRHLHPSRARPPHSLSPSCRPGSDHLLKGTQRSYIGDTLTNKQKDGYGVEVSADFKKKLGDSAALKISPFFRYWSIEDSNVSSATVSNGWYSTFAA